VAAIVVSLVSSIAVSIVSSIVGCGDGAKPAARPADEAERSIAKDERVLERRDCEALRDHQVRLALDRAFADAGPSARAAGEETARSQLAVSSAGWVDRCVGRKLTGPILRCMKEASTLETFERCGEHAGEATDAGANADAN
jgi:hypothetical protein